MWSYRFEFSTSKKPWTGIGLGSLNDTDHQSSKGEHTWQTQYLSLQIWLLVLMTHKHGTYEEYHQGALNYDKYEWREVISDPSQLDF